MENKTASTDILDLTNVSLDNPEFSTLLMNLQGNVLKHHGRTHAYHVFVQFNSETIDQLKSWLRNFAESKITTAIKQLKDSIARKNDPGANGGTFLNLSLSFSGYKKLSIPDENIPSDEAFVSGMQNRTLFTADNPADWENGLKEGIDAVVIIADSSVSIAKKEKDNFLSQIAPYATVTHIQKGKVLRNKSGIGIEHFGYADGVSQPDFLSPPNPNAKQWDDQGALLKTLLVKENGMEETYGSYFVFRKLEQNVLKFKTMEKNTLPSVKDVDNKENDELAGAMIIGRFEDGTEVINNSIEIGITTEKQLVNDFDYRSDAVGSISNGSKCPYHAHIRITNPRADVTQNFAKQVRLTRRGIPYNDIGRDEFNLDQDQPEEGVGLLFMCYQSSIKNQFEFIQDRWANKGDIGGRSVGQDVVIGQGPNTDIKKLPQQWGNNSNSSVIKPAFREFVTMKGGEYFFTPSILFLKSIS